MSEIATGRPLQGKQVLVTRTREQASVLSERLRTLGATAIEFPTIRIEPPQDWSRLDAALHRLYQPGTEHYDWLVLTSVNGVHICCQRLQALGYNPGDLSQSGVRIATIGPATADALSAYGVGADLVPSEYIAEGVVSALLAEARQRGGSVAGQRFLLARASEARKVIALELEQAGALVDDVAAYVTLPVATNDKQGEAVIRLLYQKDLDILTFTSSSTVRNFVTWLRACEQECGVALLDHINEYACLASIGPVTSQTARDLGLQMSVEAREFTINGLVQALVDMSARQ